MLCLIQITAEVGLSISLSILEAVVCKFLSQLRPGSSNHTSVSSPLSVDCMGNLSSRSYTPIGATNATIEVFCQGTW